MSASCEYSRVILIGYGQIVNNCLKTLKELSEKYKYSLTYVEYEKTDLSTSITYCEKEEIDHISIYDKENLKQYFLQGSEKKLIISAGNFYIFPQEVVEDPNNTIINFHSALLPKYPGRNAQTWAIFNKEREAGATWHFVTKEIDAGRYIIQKAVEINENTKAYELTGKIMDAAYDGFVEIVEGVITDKYDKTQNLAIDPDRKVYKGKDIPGNGHFNIDDEPEYIYRLLRSTDYGKSDIFPPIKSEINNKKIRIVSYKMIDNDGVSSVAIDEKNVLIPYNEQNVLRLRYKEIEE